MRTPVVFVSHGAPTVALEEDDYARALRRFGREVGQPRAIVVMSAHWESPGPARVTSGAHPPLVYDFAGFPESLYRLTYPAPGDPDLAAGVISALGAAGLSAIADPERGRDHGVWIPLRLIYPEAAAPVVQISLPRPAAPEDLMRLGSALAPMRDRGVLLIGSGGIVHNLRRIRLGEKEAPADPWARAFDTWFGERLTRRDIDAILSYRDRAPHADLAVPTSEHFDPVFFVLGAAGAEERVASIYDGIHHGNLSMRSFACSP